MIAFFGFNPVLSFCKNDFLKGMEELSWSGKDFRLSGNELFWSGKELSWSGEVFRLSGNELFWSGKELFWSGEVFRLSGNELFWSGKELSWSGKVFRLSGNELFWSGKVPFPEINGSFFGINGLLRSVKRIFISGVELFRRKPAQGSCRLVRLYLVARFKVNANYYRTSRLSVATNGTPLRCIYCNCYRKIKSDNNHFQLQKRAFVQIPYYRVESRK